MVFWPHFHSIPVYKIYNPELYIKFLNLLKKVYLKSWRVFTSEIKKTFSINFSGPLNNAANTIKYVINIILTFGIGRCLNFIPNTTPLSPAVLSVGIISGMFEQTKNGASKLSLEMSGYIVLESEWDFTVNSEGFSQRTWVLLKGWMFGLDAVF